MHLLSYTYVLFSENVVFLFTLDKGKVRLRVCGEKVDRFTFTGSSVGFGDFFLHPVPFGPVFVLHCLYGDSL